MMRADEYFTVIEDIQVGPCMHLPLSLQPGLIRICAADQFKVVVASSKKGLSYRSLQTPEFAQRLARKEMLVM